MQSLCAAECNPNFLACRSQFMTRFMVAPYSPANDVSDKPESLSRYYLLFFSSGFPALLYQIVWQRALFTIYGVNIQSVTVIVTVFMLGLGLGSLAGGRLSTKSGLRLLLAFGLIELGIGIYGALSMFI